MKVAKDCAETSAYLNTYCDTIRHRRVLVALIILDITDASDFFDSSCLGNGFVLP
jgi:hypothetical protein